ncbi:MAG: hypothetical protein SPE03_13720 [Treponema sp.]|nr:hypothetical protein [Treponema sp.]
MKNFEFLGWLFASQKTGYPGFRYRSSRFPRFAQSSGRLWRPYYPCHGLKTKYSKLNLKLTARANKTFIGVKSYSTSQGQTLILILFFQKKSIKIAVFLFT